MADTSTLGNTEACPRSMTCIAIYAAQINLNLQFQLARLCRHIDAPRVHPVAFRGEPLDCTNGWAGDNGRRLYHESRRPL